MRRDRDGGRPHHPRDRRRDESSVEPCGRSATPATLGGKRKSGRAEARPGLIINGRPFSHSAQGAGSPTVRRAVFDGALHALVSLRGGVQNHRITHVGVRSTHVFSAAPRRVVARMIRVRRRRHGAYASRDCGDGNNGKTSLHVFLPSALSLYLIWRDHPRPVSGVSRPRGRGAGTRCGRCWRPEGAGGRSCEARSRRVRRRLSKKRGARPTPWAASSASPHPSE